MQLKKTFYFGVSLSLILGTTGICAETIVLPPNEQISICGDASVETKQLCRLLPEEKGIGEYELSNVVSFLSVKNKVKLNGLDLPEGTLMTLVSPNKPKNNFEIELQSKGQLDVYNESQWFLKLQCDNV